MSILAVNYLDILFCVKIGFSNLNVLQNDLLLQEWVSRLGRTPIFLESGKSQIAINMSIIHMLLQKFLGFLAFDIWQLCSRYEIDNFVFILKKLIKGYDWFTFKVCFTGAAEMAKSRSSTSRKVQDPNLIPSIWLLKFMSSLKIGNWWDSESPAWIIEVVIERFSVGLKFLHRVSVSGLYVIGKVFLSLIMGLHRASKTAVSNRS